MVVSGTTTTTTSNTTVAPSTRWAAIRSSQSSAAGAVGICDYDLNVFIYKTGVTAEPEVGDIIYTSASGPTTFNGLGNYWHYIPGVQEPGEIGYIIQVNSSGEILSEVPCNA